MAERKTIILRLLRIAASGVLAAQFAHCGMSGTVKHQYTLNEKYGAANLSQRKLIVVPPSAPHIIIRNPDDVLDDYGGKNAPAESRIMKFYLPLFFQTFKASASGDSVFLIDSCKPAIEWDSLPEKTVVLRSALDAGATASQYHIPEKSSVKDKGLDSALVLSIESMEFKRNNLYVEYYWDDKTRKPSNLEVGAKVLLWDYAADAPVFYGMVTTMTTFQFSLQRKHWDENAQSLAKKILSLAKCL